MTNLLTPRELDVVACLRAGLATKGIAVRLNLSYGTVKVHLRNAARKLNCHSRSQLAVCAGDPDLVPSGTLVNRDEHDRVVAALHAAEERITDLQEERSLDLTEVVQALHALSEAIPLLPATAETVAWMTKHAGAIASAQELIADTAEGAN